MALSYLRTQGSNIGMESNWSVSVPGDPSEDADSRVVDVNSLVRSHAHKVA